MIVVMPPRVAPRPSREVLVDAGEALRWAREATAKVERYEHERHEHRIAQELHARQRHNAALLPRAVHAVFSRWLKPDAVLLFWAKKPLSQEALEAALAVEDRIGPGEYGRGLDERFASALRREALRCADRVRTRAEHARGRGEASVQIDERDWNVTRNTAREVA